MTQKTPLEIVALVEKLAERIHGTKALGEKARLLEETTVPLRALDVEAPNCSGWTYIQEKISRLRWHLDSMAGVGNDHGLGAQEHYRDALGVIDILKGSLGFNQPRRDRNEQME